MTSLEFESLHERRSVTLKEATSNRAVRELMPAEHNPRPREPVPADRFLTMFVPEAWSPARRFSFFLGPPFPETRRLVQAARAAENRRQKFCVLADLANHLRPGLSKDNEELESTGFTSATNSKRYAAVVETLFLELYSSLDVIRTTLYEAYHPRIRGLPRDSTERLLRRVSEGYYGPEFPEPLLHPLSSAFRTWYAELRRVRVEISHGDIGRCHIDPSSGRVVYMHTNLGPPERSLVIDDLEAKVEELAVGVRDLVDSVFSFLCSELQSVEVQLPCGFFRGRLYERLVAYSDQLDFNSGVCYSRWWFEIEPEHLCPMRKRCGAYSR